MGAAQRYTLFTLFILFKLLYTVKSSMYADVYILLGKVRTLLECAVEQSQKNLGSRVAL